MKILKFLDLPHLAIAVVFLALLTFLPVVDPDYFWHLVTGQYILQHGLPDTDMFSWTAAGTPWVLHEWLFEVVLYGAWTALGGEFGVRVLVALFATATLAVMYHTARRLTGRPYPALLVALGCFGLVLIGITPRPQLVTFLLLAIWLRVLAGHKYFGETRGLWLLPALMVAWVNAHGGYAIGLAVLAFFTACEAVAWLAAPQRDAARLAALKRLGVALGATLLASLANPWFAAHWAYPFAVVDMEASKNFISEWRTPNFHDLRNKAYLVAGGLFLLLSIYRRHKPDLTEVAVPMVFLLMGCISIRHTPLAAIALATFMAVAIRDQPLAAMVPAHWRARLADGWARRTGQGKDLGDTEYLLNAVLLAVLLAATAAWYPVQQRFIAQTVREFVPVGAVDYVVQQGITGRVFNTYHFGGYLIYRLYPAQRVYIDGRADMYGDDAVKQYARVADGQPGWDATFDALQVDYLVLQRTQALRQLLLARGDYRLVYDDDFNSVLVRAAGPWGALPLQDARSPAARLKP